MEQVLFNKINIDELVIGDHIYTWRNGFLYAHHGIYVADGKVIHFTPAAGREVGTGTFLDRVIFSSSPSRRSGPECPRCGDSRRNEGVISSCLGCFLSGGNLYRFRYGASTGMFLAQPLHFLTPGRMFSSVLKLFSITVLETTTFSRTTVRISLSTARPVICTSELGAWGAVAR
ncbi:hypothetical protein HAX54_024715 [Datura stramonium]|uniref:LRAT domain-containing protein n=1 Tax=Datura stramonium TaxID=4076 RepID=A0ABS8RGL1_DATST|nr:hypothetical protein [Datura stramonium]